MDTVRDEGERDEDGRSEAPAGDLRGADLGRLLEDFRWTTRLAHTLVRDPALAADLNQDAWTLALTRFGAERPTRRWFAGTLRSLAFRSRRGGDRRRRREAEVARGESLPSAAELSERSEAQQRVAALVQTLPEAERVALQLHFQEGLGVTTIADRLGLAKSTVSARLKAGQARLRRQLEVEDGGRALALLAAPLGAATLPPGLPSAPAAPHASVPIPSGAATAPAPTPAALAGTTGVNATLSLLLMTKTALGIGLGLAAATGLFLLLPPLDSPDAAPAVAQRSAQDEALVAPAAPGDAPRVEPDVLQAEARSAVASGPSPTAAPDPATHYLLRGAVVDEADEPLTGATARIRFRDEFVHATQTHEDGSFLLALDADDLADVPADRSLSIEVYADPYHTLQSVWIPRDGTGRFPFPRVGGSDDLGTVRLEPAGAVAGVVVDASGQPVAGAQVHVLGIDPNDPKARRSYGGDVLEPRTDADGRFLMGNLLEGPCKLDALHPSMLDERKYLPIEVTAGQTLEGLRLQLQPAVQVAGVVVDTRGEPVETAYVNGTGNWNYLNSDVTGPDGRYEIYLRTGAPAEVEAYAEGYTQLEPRAGAMQAGGTLRIVLQKDLSEGAFEVAVVDAASGAPIDEVGLRVVPNATEESFDGRYPQPEKRRGAPLRLDLRPGEDRLAVSATGFLSQLVETTDAADAAPHFTVELQRRPGITGTLLLEGLPLADAHVLLTDTDLHVAAPREELRAGRTVRHPQGVDIYREYGLTHYSPVHVIGLDGPPPTHHLEPYVQLVGTRTDAEGHFHLEVPADERDSSHVMLTIDTDAGIPFVVEAFELPEDAPAVGTDLGTIELDPSATLTGRVQLRGPWDPTLYFVEMESPQRRAPLAADGSFRFERAQPGDRTLRLRMLENADDSAPPDVLHKAPAFHLRLASGEVRHLELDLDAYRRVQLALDLTVSGEPPPAGSRIQIAPVDAPERSFSLWCDLEGERLTTEAPALGPVLVTLAMTAPGQGWGELSAPDARLELEPGDTITGRLDFPGGGLRVRLDPESPAAQEKRLTFVLEREGRPAREIRSVSPQPTGSGSETRLDTVPVPPGVYRVRLYRARWGKTPRGTEALAAFEVEILAGERVEIDLR